MGRCSSLSANPSRRGGLSSCWTTSWSSTRYVGNARLSERELSCSATTILLTPSSLAFAQCPTIAIHKRGAPPADPPQPGLAGLARAVVANKMDQPGSVERLKELRRRMRARGIPVFPVSALEGWGAAELIDGLAKLQHRSASGGGVR